jgi:hypothetical protein
MHEMKMVLGAAVTAVSFTSAAFAGEGYNPSQFVGVTAGFNDGTPQGIQAEALAKYFQNQAEQTARAHQTNRSMATVQPPRTKG